jgi:peptidoglycan hydrolase CwlO-like protein
LEKWKLRYVETVESIPLKYKIVIGVLSVLLVIAVIVGSIGGNRLYNLQFKRDALEEKNLILQKDFDNLSNSIVHYRNIQEESDKRIDTRTASINRLNRNFKTINDDYLKEIDDITSGAISDDLSKLSGVIRKDN